MKMKSSFFHNLWQFFDLKVLNGVVLTYAYAKTDWVGKKNKSLHDLSLCKMVVFGLTLLKKFQTGQKNFKKALYNKKAKCYTFFNRKTPKCVDKRQGLFIKRSQRTVGWCKTVFAWTTYPFCSRATEKKQ